MVAPEGICDVWILEGRGPLGVGRRGGMIDRSGHVPILKLPKYEGELFDWCEGVIDAGIA